MDHTGKNYEYNTPFSSFRQEKTAADIRPPRQSLLLSEGHAVGALLSGRVAFMGTHHDLVQGAVVLAVAVIGALLNGAFDGLIGMTVHK